MSASEALSPIQFSFSPAESRPNDIAQANGVRGGGQDPDHVVHAWAPGDQHVGTLRWNAIDGDVEHVGVDPDYRRQGVATGMWKYAQGQQGVQSPRHAPADERSADGKAWAKSVKGPGFRRTFQ